MLLKYYSRPVLKAIDEKVKSLFGLSSPSVSIHPTLSPTTLVPVLKHNDTKRVSAASV